MKLTLVACVATFVAAAASAWQAWRGYQLQANSKHYAELARDNQCKAKLLYTVADGFTHGVLALAGWASLWVAADKLLQLQASPDPSVGGVAFAFGLGLFGLLGITGQVPTILRLNSE